MTLRLIWGVARFNAAIDWLLTENHLTSIVEYQICSILGKTFNLFAAAFLLNLTLTGNVPAMVITPVGVVCSGSWGYFGPFGSGGVYGCAGLIDGVTDDSIGYPPASYWLGREQLLNETFTVDLGGDFLVTSLDLYNTHNGLNLTSNDRGTKDFKVWISTAPVIPDTSSLSFGTEVLNGSLAFFTFTNPNPKQSFDIAPTVGRYITFRAETYQGAGGSAGLGAGLSEIVVNVPEPASLALLSIGLLGIAVTRHHNQLLMSCW